MNRLGQVGQPLWLSVCGFALAALAGCSGPLLRSQRFAEVQTKPGMACDSAGEACNACECRHIVDHFFVFARAPHALLPGSVADRQGLIPLRPGQAAQDIPHSKFHPVPTRPVFAARAHALRFLAAEPVPVEASIVPLPAADAAPMELELNPSESIPAPLEPTPEEPTPATSPRAAMYIED